jgi:hypothetical protein
MRFVNLSSEDFNSQVQKHYLITLIDVVYGSSIAELVEELSFFEQEEQYEICSGIKKAIEFCKGKNILDIKKEIVALSEELKDI